jgi:large subunit ribosomal protein L21
VTYAIIRLGGKQYRVSEGERVLVDRLRFDESATFNPDVLFVGGGGSDGAAVTARVVGHTLGPKIRIGKYKKRTGYRRHTGYRSRLSEIEIQSIGTPDQGSRKAPAKPKDEPQDVPKAIEAKAPAGLPDGYADMTVAQIHDDVKSWSPEQIQAALEYEQGHAARKGALSALESAAAKEEES